MPLTQLTLLSLKNNRQKNKFLIALNPELEEYYNNFKTEKDYHKPKIEDGLIALTVPKNLMDRVKIGRPFKTT